MSSPEGVATLSTADRRSLLDLAADSIRYGLHHGRPLPVDGDDFPARLTAPGATFVTLHLGNELRGCIGSLEARRPLVEDVVHNAYAAAFEDPRFPPLRPEEFPDLDIHIAVLGPLQPLRFQDEADLVRQLRPGVDGLVLQAGHRRGTFLPAVWEQLPDPAAFLCHLKRKAGLPTDWWSDDVQVWRYATESFGQAPA